MAATAETSSDPALAAIQKFIAEQKIDTNAPSWRTRLPKPPQVSFDPKKTYRWVIETNVGTLKFKLLPDVAPLHAASYLYLTTLGYYDGLKFHRVIRGFMAQGGDPLGNGRGGPGYEMKTTTRGDVKHSRAGILSTANAGRDTDGSQFFITFRALSSLDGGYTVAGEAVEGVETTLKELEKRGAASDPGTPSEPLFIKKATLEIA